LLVAPHELSGGELTAVLNRGRWAWVHLTSAGTDFVDLNDWPQDILLTRSWQCYAAPLAEYALGAMLSYEWRHGDPWSDGEQQGRRGLWGARVGIAGWGAVGRRIAAVASALGAEVRVLSTTLRRSTPSVTHTRRLDDILDGDHLVVALPLTPVTRQLLDRDALLRARHGLHLINVSRAALVDQDVLTDLCETGAMSATLDVSEPEPLPVHHLLRRLPSVRYSPHVAWHSRDSEYAFVKDFALIWWALALPTAHIPGRVARTSPDRARRAITRFSIAERPQ
jgi:phosphoglycerate dehydrogenase-like enzyme